MTKYFLIVIIFYIFPIAGYCHPITQLNYEITIEKEKGQIKVKTKQNLAFLLSKSLISDFEKYDKEYKRLLALSNDEFYQEALANKSKLISKFESCLGGIVFDQKDIIVNINTRKPQSLESASNSGNLIHSDEINCEITFKGSFKYTKDLKFIWNNEDFVVTDILKIYIDDNSKPEIIWVAPMEEKGVILEKISQDPLSSIKEFIYRGFIHILPDGLDHILFMLCIFFLFITWKSTLIQVSTFTIAHSITLILVTLKTIYVPSNIIEPLIALSICVVGIENLFAEKVHRYRLIIIYFFGLLHGLGFADALSKIELPENQILTSLLAFNVGVELGQIVVIGSAYLLIGHWWSKKQWYRSRIAIPCSFAISLYAFYLFISRLPIKSFFL